LGSPIKQTEKEKHMETKQSFKVAGNFPINDDFKVAYAVVEFNPAGKSVPPAVGDTCKSVSSNPSALIVTPDASVDPAKVPTAADGSIQVAVETGFISGVKGQDVVGMTVTSTISHADGSAIAPALDTFDTIADPNVASTAAILLGTPQPQ
jgi:hypothetical protein